MVRSLPIAASDADQLTEAKLRLLDLLARSDAATVPELADRLELTAMAVRQHLAALEEDGLVETAGRREGARGRPAALWRTTERAGDYLPDRHADLTVALLASIRRALGEEGLDAVIADRTRQQLRLYRERIPREAPLGRRVKALARQRTLEGYVAEAREEESGCWLLVEHHCPICDAAEACAGLCRAELELFRAALGDDVEVERTRHLLGGDRRCAYRIRPKA